MNSDQESKPATVAILLPTFNGERYLREQLMTLVGQIGAAVHIYVRDDGSSDETLTILQQFEAAHLGTLTIVNDDHGRAGSAAGNFFRLIGHLDASEYEFVAFADQDDIWFPEKLARAISAIREHDAWGYGSNLLTYDAERCQGWMIDKAQPQRERDYLFQGASAGCTYVIRREAFEAVKSCLAHDGATTSLQPSHDWLIYAVCRSTGGKWHTDHNAAIVYRQHDENVYGALPGFGGALSRFRMVKSRWYRRHVLYVLGLLRRDDFEDRIYTAINRMSFGDKIWLALNCAEFRRRRLDQLLLAFAILLGIF